MDARTLARQHALGRVLVGTGLTLAPRLAGQGWMGRDSRRPATQVAIRAFGARDLAIGLGTAYTAGQGYGARPWLWAGVLADATDFAATLKARDALSPAAVAVVGGIAAGSAVLGLWLGSQLD
ncbi:MAG: hypothetical protein QOE53_3088 [Pseudonocardiales bacterium]|nr:hypothetical protein [Pseudonocardiales bacterium]